MAKYKISGIWKTQQGVITHYAFHEVMPTYVTRATKISKADAVKLLEVTGNTAITRLWNYKTGFWMDGESVHVVNGASGKFLRTNHDGNPSDNLAHLIDYDWI